MLSIIVLLASLALLPTAVIAQSTVKCAGNPYSYAPMTEASSTGTFQFPCGESTTLKSNANTIAPGGTCRNMECIAQMCCEACINCPAPAPVVPAICEHKSSFDSTGMYTLPPSTHSYPCSGLVGMSIVKGGFPWYTAQCADFLNPALSYLTSDHMPGFNGCCNDNRNTCVNGDTNQSSVSDSESGDSNAGGDSNQSSESDSESGDSNQCAGQSGKDGKEPLTAECDCGGTHGGSGSCAKGKYCWMGMICRDTPYPCGDKEQFCGRYNLKGKSYEEQDKMYKEDFKGGCLDMTTCPDDVKDDERTECERFIAESNEPGKCYAVCTIGFSKVGHDSLKDQNKCTDDEKKQYDEVTEKNEAAYKASLSSGSAVAPTLAAVTTAAIVVFAALY